MTGRTYRESGVDIEAAVKVRDLFKPHIRSTFGPQVLSDVGLFGGLYQLQGYHDLVLVASTDGVGTKLKLAHWLDRYESIGHDVVNQSVNDVLTTGARPGPKRSTCGCAPLQSGSPVTLAWTWPPRRSLSLPT